MVSIPLVKYTVMYLRKPTEEKKAEILKRKTEKFKKIQAKAEARKHIKPLNFDSRLSNFEQYSLSQHPDINSFQQNNQDAMTSADI